MDGRALNIERVIEGLGIRIVPVPGLSEIAEAYVPIKPQYLFIDEQQYLAGSYRYRFTLAEELAHIMIHRCIFDGLPVPEIMALQERITDREYAMIERQAKRLASAILMPRESITTRFRQHYEVQSQVEPNQLKVLINVVRQLNYDFFVSCYSIALRLRQLDLIDQEQLDELLERF